jgi:hypothetical protein
MVPGFTAKNSVIEVDAGLQYGAMEYPSHLAAFFAQETPVADAAISVPEVPYCPAVFARHRSCNVLIAGLTACLRIKFARLQEARCA